MKLGTLCSFLGLAAAIAGPRAASGQDCDCSDLPNTPPTECTPEAEAQLDRALCCAQADVDAAAEALASAQAALDAAEDALDLAQQARGEVCLSWEPTIGQTWNYHLNARDERPEDPSIGDVDVYMIDMDGPITCDGDNNCVEDTAVIEETLRALKADGKYVVCYINIGTFEPWRLDAHKFQEIGGDILGEELQFWDTEKWVDVTYTTDGADEPAVYAIMRDRVAKAEGLGCDGIEPDNMDVAYVAAFVDTGVDVSKQESIDYARWFANYVHTETSMKVAMKNLVWDDETTPLLAALAQEFDFSINEECARYNECDTLVDWFISFDKPVFHVEYRGKDNETRRKSHIKNTCNNSPSEFSNIIKTYPVYGPFCTCDSSNNYDATWTCTKSLNRNF